MTFKSLQVVALTALSMSSTTFAEESTSKLMVHIPHSLYKTEGYPHKEAMFGMPPYGGSIAQNVYYADQDMCDSFVNVTKGYPERANPDDPWPSPFILLVDRGTCPFTTKVRNAQRVGAAGVLIADDTCLCSATDCVSDQACQATEPIMADDGSGADISIPSMLVYKQDGDLFKKEVKANHPMQVEMIWSLPTPDDRVEYDLWTTPTDAISKDFLRTFRRIAISLDHRAYFTPHQYIYDGARSGCIGQARDENACESLCTNNGRYCATDPDGDLDQGISGAQVVHESLRRLCIWEHYGRKDGIGVRWWNYVENFAFHCNAPELFAQKKCILEVYEAAGIEFEVVERCIRDSGGLEADAPNNKLDMEISSEVARGVVVIPSAYVNNVPVRGALTAANIFTAICAGYAQGTEPVVCKQCTRCPNPVDCVETGFCTNAWEHHIIKHLTDKDGNGGISSYTFYLTVLVCMGAVVAMGTWYHNRSNVQMREQMRGLLAQYMPLDDDDAANPMEFGTQHHAAASNPLLMTTEGTMEYHPTGSSTGETPPHVI